MLYTLVLITLYNGVAMTPLPKQYTLEQCQAAGQIAKDQNKWVDYLCVPNS